jgi:hypothetical protein
MGDPGPRSVRAHRGRYFVAGFVTAALVAGGIALGWTQSRSSGPTYVSVHVVACQSTYPFPGAQPPLYPPTITIKEPSSVKGQLAFYSDRYRILAPVLAPKAWSCSTSLGVDGGYGMAVYPPGQPDTINSSGPAHGSVETVIADGSVVCVGCSEAIACSVFTTALLNLYPSPCPLTSPHLESVAYLSGSPSAKSGTAQVYDPHGVFGSLPQSGGSNPATGIIDFSAAQVTSARVLSCVLPGSEAVLCSTISSEFVKSEPRR